jgi:phosphoribosyl isomerase A
MTLELLPAVDLLDGQAARLVQGVAGTETGYGDPVEAATGFAAQGARWLHVVDLDAAFGRGPRNREHLGRIVEAVAPAVRVEASGGVRTAADLHALLDLGAARVVIGTAALEDPEWVAEACTRHGEAVAVGLDARGRTLQARGWTASGGDLFEVLRRLEAAGCRRFVHTEVARDGMLTGPATDRLGEVLAATSRPVIASGGVARLGDLRALATLEPDGLEGAIVGKALYAGRFTVGEALATLAEAAPNPGAQGPGARASQPPVAGAPEREGSRWAGGAGGAVHSPPAHTTDSPPAHPTDRRRA